MYVDTEKAMVREAQFPDAHAQLQRQFREEGELGFWLLLAILAGRGRGFEVRIVQEGEVCPWLGVCLFIMLPALEPHPGAPQDIVVGDG